MTLLCHPIPSSTELQMWLRETYSIECKIMQPKWGTFAVKLSYVYPLVLLLALLPPANLMNESLRLPLCFFFFLSQSRRQHRLTSNSRVSSCLSFLSTKFTAMIISTSETFILFRVSLTNRKNHIAIHRSPRVWRWDSWVDTWVEGLGPRNVCFSQS